MDRKYSLGFRVEDDSVDFYISTDSISLFAPIKKKNKFLYEHINIEAVGNHVHQFNLLEDKHFNNFLIKKRRDKRFEHLTKNLFEGIEELFSHEFLLSQLKVQNAYVFSVKNYIDLEKHIFSLEDFLKYIDKENLREISFKSLYDYKNKLNFIFSNININDNYQKFLTAKEFGKEIFNSFFIRTLFEKEFPLASDFFKHYVISSNSDFSFLDKFLFYLPHEKTEELLFKENMFFTLLFNKRALHEMKTVFKWKNSFIKEKAVESYRCFTNEMQKCFEMNSNDVNKALAKILANNTKLSKYSLNEIDEVKRKEDERIKNPKEYVVNDIAFSLIKKSAVVNHNIKNIEKEKTVDFRF